MERTLCAWWREWALRRPDAPSDSPCVVVDQAVVVAANEQARLMGVSRGMPRREGEALCAAGVVLERDLGAEASAFEAVASVVEELVPKVEIADPGLLFVPVMGALGFYGGEAKLLERIQDALDEVVPGARLGLANGPFAARWAAHLAAEAPVIVENDAEFLASLRVETLDNRDLVATFRWIGIGTLGDLARLPRAAVLSRFGGEGLTAHRLASGEDRPVIPRPIHEDLTIEEKLEEPLVLLEQAGFLARALSYRLMGLLRPRGVAPHRVEVEAESADGTVLSRVWRSADPFTEDVLAERVWWQLRAWIESGGIPGGLTRLKLSPADTSGVGRQLALLEDTVARLETERALGRAQALVGPDRVLEARPQGGRDPGERVRWHRWGEPVGDPERDPNAPWPGRIPGQVPALVPDQEPIEVEWEGGLPVRVRLRSRWEPVLNWAGPWRRHGRWWREEPSRDVYQIVTSATALLCERYEDRTMLLGLYD